jgi:serine/threonine protein kinase
MTIDSGTRLSHYEIISRIGAGGMGEVYLAAETFVLFSSYSVASAKDSMEEGNSGQEDEARQCLTPKSGQQR